MEELFGADFEMITAEIVGSMNSYFQDDGEKV